MGCLAIFKISISILCVFFFSVFFSLSFSTGCNQLYIPIYQDTNLHTFLFLSLDESALIFAHYLSKSLRNRFTARGKWLIRKKRRKHRPFYALSPHCLIFIQYSTFFSSFAGEVCFFPHPFSFVSNDACIIMEEPRCTIGLDGWGENPLCIQYIPFFALGT